MAIDFPSGDPNLPPAALTGESLGTMHGGAGHPAVTNRFITNIKALAQKLGYGAGSGPGASAGVLRRTGTGLSDWGLVVGGDIAPATIDPSKLTTPVGTAGGPRLALGYALPSEISGLALTTGTWNTLVTLPSFTVDSASSLVSVSIQLSMLVGGGTGTQVMGRLLLDGTTPLPLGGHYHGPTDSPYSNPATGGSTVWPGSLAAGSHTLALQVYPNATGQNVYCRAVTLPNLEWFRAQVVEHKMGGAAWTPRGAWSSAIAYGANDVVNYNGSSYVAIQTGTNQPPSSSPTFWVLLASVGGSILWRGAWAGATAYAVNDVVTRSGTTYICILASTGHDPSTDGGVHWAVMVAPGTMANPMTTADDIIVGGSGGAPARLAKGPASRVFGVDASGVLGYRQVVGADLVAGTLNSTQVGLGAAGIHGNRLVPLSITSAEIMDSGVTAAKVADGAINRYAQIADALIIAQKIADGNVTWAKMAAGAATKIAAGALDGNTLTLSGGFQTCTGTPCSITVSAGSSLLVMFCGEPTASGSANLYFQLTGATVANSNASAYLTPTRQNIAIFNYFNPNAGTHTVSMMVAGSGVFNSNAATTVATILAIELKKPG